jgi:hypothetical protein
MINTHKIKKKIGGTGRIYRLFKNIQVDKNIYYTGQYSSKISFVNQFQVALRVSRPVLAIQKPETLLKEEFHLGIDKHRLLLISTSGQAKGSNKYLIFRTTTKKVLRRIPVSQTRRRLISNCQYNNDTGMIYTMVCKNKGFSVNIKTCKIADFGVEDAIAMRKTDPVFFHQYDKKHDYNYILNKFRLEDGTFEEWKILVSKNGANYLYRGNENILPLYTTNDTNQIKMSPLTDGVNCNTWFVNKDPAKAQELDLKSDILNIEIYNLVWSKDITSAAVISMHDPKSDTNHMEIFSSPFGKLSYSDDLFSKNAYFLQIAP